MSSGSEISSLHSLVARPVLPKGPSIKIKIHDHFISKTYGSGSPVSGEVVITPWKDTRFDFVSIILIGLSRTRLDAAQISQHSSHTFLKLTMPIPESAYPVPRVFEAGHTYTVPFHFVIPQHLTLSACSHHKQSDAVYDQHMRLPPSMGHWGRDDLSPEMARVEYLVKARVAEQPEVGGRPIKLMEADHHFNVLPTSVEDPPLSLSAQDKGYTLSRSKNVRKNLFSGKQGRITATAVQPAAIRLQPDGRAAADTELAIDLRFDPTSVDVPAPRASHVSAKLQAATWFSAAPIANLPDLGDPRKTFATVPQLSYSTSVPLFSADVNQSSTSWQQRATSAARRDSGYSSEEQGQSDSDDSHNDSSRRRTAAKGGSGSGSSSAKGKSNCPIYHQARLHIPFRIPASRKMFLPTFHTCLSSRTYTLQVSLTVGDAKLNLSIPLQLVVEPSAEQMAQSAGLPSFDAVMALREEEAADELLRGRVMRQPAQGFRETSVLPGYDELMLGRSGLRAA